MKVIGVELKHWTIDSKDVQSYRLYVQLTTAETQEKSDHVQLNGIRIETLKLGVRSAQVLCDNLGIKSPFDLVNKEFKTIYYDANRNIQSLA